MNGTGGENALGGRAARLPVPLAVATAATTFIGFAIVLAVTGTPAGLAFYAALFFACFGIALCFGGAAWWLPRLLAQADLVQTSFRPADAARDCGEVYAETVARYARPVWFLPVGLVFAAAITFVLPRQMVGQSVSFLPETIVPAWYGLVAISAFGIGIGHMMMAAGLLAIIVASRDCSVTIEALPRLRRLARFYARLTLYLLLVYANYVAYLIVAYVGGVAFSGAVIITTLLVGAGILTFLLLPQLLIRNRLAEAKDRMLATLLDEFGLSDDNSVEGAMQFHARLQAIESLPEWAVDWGRVTVILNAYLAPSAALVAVTEPLRDVFT